MAVAEEQVPAPTAGGRGGWRERGQGAALGFVLGVATFLLMFRTLGDDALISVSYARSLAGSGTWGVFPGLTANTQTSPLNVWLLASGIAATGQPILVVGGVYSACLAGCGWLATGVSTSLGLSALGGWAATTLIATSPVMVSTIGLETVVAVLVLLGLVSAALRRRVVASGVLVGLAVLVRPDLLVPAAVLVLLLVRRGDGREAGPRPVVPLARTAGVAALVAVPWHLWSWFALGGAVPDTMWVRTGERGPGILGAVPIWLHLYPGPAAAGVALAVAGVVAAAGALARRGEPWAVVVVAVVLAAWTYLLGLAAVSAQGASWYYGPTVALSALAVGLSLAALGRRWAVTGTAVAAIAAVVGVATAGPVPWTWLPLAANYAETRQYAAIATELPRWTGGEPVEGPGEVGALAFHGSVPVLDFLTDPARTTARMCERAARGGLRADLIRWSSTHRAATAPRPTRWLLAFSGFPLPAGSRVVRTWTVGTPVRGADTLRLVETPPRPTRPAPATAC